MRDEHEGSCGAIRPKFRRRFFRHLHLDAGSRLHMMNCTGIEIDARLNELAMPSSWC